MKTLTLAQASELLKEWSQSLNTHATTFLKLALDTPEKASEWSVDEMQEDLKEVANLLDEVRKAIRAQT